MKIPLIKSTFHNERETKRRLVRFIESAKTLSMGQQCIKFEEVFAKKQGRKFAIFVNSGSSANLILIQSLLNLGRLKRGDRVGVSSVTWATNVMPLIKLDLVPVPVDCNLPTINVSPETLAKHLSGLKALFITNVLGFADDLPMIAKACRKAGVLLLEDNCESLGSRMAGRHLGNFGLASTFSFFVGHHLSTIEGGMVVTDDRELYEMLLMVRAHGWDRHLPEKKRRSLRKAHGLDDHFGKYAFYHLAYNVRPTEIQGFLGLQAMRYWDDIVAAREKNFRAFQDAAAVRNDIHALSMNHMDTVSNFAFPVISVSEQAARALLLRFEAAGVEVRPVISGDITLHPFWKRYVGTSPVCESSRIVHYQGFYFGNNPELTKKEIELIRRLLASS